MRHPLRNQILVPVAILVAIAVVGVSAVAAWRAARAVDQRIEAHLSGVADVLLHGGFPLTDSVLRQAGTLAGAEFVCLDAAGSLLASGREDSQPLRDTLKAPGAADQTIVRAADGVEYWHRTARAPARPGLESGLELHMFYPQQLRRQLVNEAVVPMFIVGAGALVVACGLSFVLAARISRPLAAVREHFARLGFGHYDLLPRPARDDEIRDLVDSANLLAKQLEERTRAVQRASRSSALGQLSGGLCHHLRNAAAGAKLALQLHRRRCSGPDLESLDVALKQLDQIERYLQQLLTLGKPQLPRPADVELQRLVRDAAALVEPAFKHRNIPLEIDLPADSTVLTDVDAEMLRQVVVNLLINAVEAADFSGWARLTVAVDDDDVRIRVSDGGAGPPQAVVDRLFEPFVTSKPDGVGLGLAAARRIVQQHGGTLMLVGTHPTCFEISLPRRSALRSMIDGDVAESAADFSIPTAVGERVPT